MCLLWQTVRPLSAFFSFPVSFPIPSCRMEQYLKFDFSSNPEWVAYRSRLEIPAGQDHLIEKYMRKWYLSNIDSKIEFDHRSHPQVPIPPNKPSFSTPNSTSNSVPNSNSSSASSSSSSSSSTSSSFRSSNGSSSNSSNAQPSRQAEGPIILSIYIILHTLVLLSGPLSVLGVHGFYDVLQFAAMLTYASSLLRQLRSEKPQFSLSTLANWAYRHDDTQYFLYSLLFWLVSPVQLSFPVRTASIAMHLIFASFALAIRIQSLVILLSRPQWVLAARAMQYAGRAQRFLSRKPLMQFVHLSWAMLLISLAFDALLFGLLSGSLNRSALAALLGMVQLVRWRARTVGEFAVVVSTLLHRVPGVLGRPLRRLLLA